jgi:hypothetical protein
VTIKNDKLVIRFGETIDNRFYMIIVKQPEEKDFSYLASNNVELRSVVNAEISNDMRTIFLNGRDKPDRLISFINVSEESRKFIIKAREAVNEYNQLGRKDV